MRKLMIKETSQRRKFAARTRIKNSSNLLRLSVFRSNRYIYGQIIDDSKGKALFTISEKEIKDKKEKMTKSQKALTIGKLLGQKAFKKGIKKVVFDRGGYKYHGRVKNFAQGAREGGLNF